MMTKPLPSHPDVELAPTTTIASGGNAGSDLSPLWQVAQSSVPEPGSALVIVVAAGGLLGARSSRRARTNSAN